MCITTRFTTTRIGERRRPLRCPLGWIREPPSSIRIIFLPSANRLHRIPSRRSETGTATATTKSAGNAARRRLELYESHRGKSCNRCASQRNAQHHPCQDVAEEMHSQHDPGDGNVQCQEQKDTF